VLINPSDAALDQDEWRPFVLAQGFGHLVASGRGRDVAVVVPTQYVLEHDVVLLHLARPNPVWAAIDENPTVLLSVAGDWAYVPSAWKTIGDEDPATGIPTTYYASAQLTGAATVVDEPDELAALLRRQLGTYEPELSSMDPAERGARLRQIRGLRIEIAEVRAKFKYGGNVDEEHRLAVADRLAARRGPGDEAARAHLLRRTEAQR
jgi:transcriptional regulator